MRLSMETFVLRNRFGDEKAFAMLREAGFDAVDFSFYWYEDPWYMKEDYQARAEELKAALGALGMSCAQAHAPFEMMWGGEFSLENPHYLQVIRSMEAAAILGAKCIVVHALDRSVETPEEETVDMNYRYYKSLQPWCERFGIQVAVENLFLYDTKRRSVAGLFCTPESLCGILRKLDSKWFTACVDVGHASVCGWEPEEFIRRMDPALLGALHIQDTDYLDDRHTMPYLGDLHWEAIMAALREKGFKDGINLEIISYVDRFPDVFLPDILALAGKMGRYLMGMLEA